MSLWATNETVTADKANQKTVFVGATAPTSTFAGQVWMDTTADVPIVKVRNAANTKWLFHNYTLRKTADETVNNSVTLQNDDHLVTATLPASSAWAFDLLLVTVSSAVADFKFMFTGPAGTIFNLAFLVGGTTYEGGTLTEGSTAGFVSGNGGEVPVWIRGTLTLGGTAGTLQLQWAQNTAEVSNTVVQLGSYLHLQQLT